ncbi:TetR/AcrR family transcriptional regulator [Streptomyces sp. PmtG]
MTPPTEGAPASRRARHRAQTTAEIKATALRHLTEGGADAVALRGIARDMGMAPGTFYSYFDTREALLAALAADAYRTLAARLREARDSAPDPAGRAVAHGLAYREWALAHPQEFRLLFSGRSPHADTADTADTAEAEYELCLGIVEIATTTGPPPPSHPPYAWTDFAPAFTEVARAAFPTLTPETLARSLRLWGRMHGLVTLEIDGLLHPQTTTPERLYRDELTDIATWLHESPPAP